jgi:hypothetical protein
MTADRSRLLVRVNAVDGKLVDKRIIDRARRIFEFDARQNVGFTA